MMHRKDDGFFQKCMSTGVKMDNCEGPGTLDLQSIEEMQETEQALENLLDHAARTERARDEAEEVLVAIMGAWTRVKRARAKAGY
jgi:hypothetical protein